MSQSGLQHPVPETLVHGLATSIVALRCAYRGNEAFSYTVIVGKAW